MMSIKFYEHYNAKQAVIMAVIDKIRLDYLDESVSLSTNTFIFF
jgi:hypothetical protein